MAARSVVRLGGRLKELRLHLCQKSPSSQGVRDFVEQSYVHLKQANPSFPILVRECSGAQPALYARYEYGQETHVSLNNLSSSQVMDAVGQMAAGPPKSA